MLHFVLLNPAELDPSFGNHGIVKTDMGAPFNNNSIGRQVLVQPGGSIYIIFNYPTFISKRFPDGSHRFKLWPEWVFRAGIF